MLMFKHGHFFYSYELNIFRFYFFSIKTKCTRNIDILVEIILQFGVFFSFGVTNFDASLESDGEKNLWRCHNSINEAIIWQWSRIGGNGWREFSSDSKTEFGAVLHSSLTPEKYWLFVWLQFVYILCLFCIRFVFNGK